MPITTRTPLLAAAGVLAAVVAGCGASEKPAPSAKQVYAAMSREPRIVETISGGPQFSRVVVNAKTEYLALYSHSGELVDMVKGRIEYRRAGSGCFGRYQASPPSARFVWRGDLAENKDSGYRAKVSGDTVVYRGTGGESGSSVTVDAGTLLIRSTADIYPRSTGIHDNFIKLSYPKSIAELPIPTNICDPGVPPLSAAAYARLLEGKAPHRRAAR
jgi:hypothetical protein